MVKQTRFDTMICDKHSIVNDGDTQFTLNTVKSVLSDSIVFESNNQ